MADTANEDVDSSFTTCTQVYICTLIDQCFNANFSSISAILWRSSVQHSYSEMQCLYNMKMILQQSLVPTYRFCLE